MENINKDTELDNTNKKLIIFDVRVSCPKCGSDFIGDIGYDNWQCFECDETWRQKSKTGLESN